jgi:hypothetical protein
MSDATGGAASSTGAAAIAGETATGSDAGARGATATGATTPSGPSWAAISTGGATALGIDGAGTTGSSGV